MADSEHEKSGPALEIPGAGPLVLRRPFPQETPELIHLHKVALRSVGADAGDGPWDRDLDDVQANYVDDGGDFLVAVVGSTVVGMGAIRRVDSDTAEMKRLRVHPTWQGQGIGMTLIAALERRAAELGFRRIILDTTPAQLAAVRLYESRGYRAYGSAVVAGLDSTLYEKHLDEPVTRAT